MVDRSPGSWPGGHALDDAAEDLAAAGLGQLGDEPHRLGLRTTCPGPRRRGRTAPRRARASPGHPGRVTTKQRMTSPLRLWGTPTAADSDDGLVAVEDRLDLGRPEPLAGHLDRVVAAAVEEPVAVLVDRGPVAVDPDVRPSRPVGRQVALGIAPDPSRHRRPGLGADQLADPLARSQRPAVRVIHVDGHPQRRADQRARLQRRDREGREQAGADLRPAGDVDDRQPAPADVLEQPSPGLGVPRLAGRGEDPQPAEVVRPHRLDAVLDQGADQGRRDAQDRDPVPLDHRPEPVGRGVVGHALGEDDRPPRGQAADQLPGAHDPAQVGDPEAARRRRACRPGGPLPARS